MTKERKQRIAVLLPSAARDLASIVGGGLLSYGAGMMYRPAGFIVCGLLLLSAGIMASRAAAYRARADAGQDRTSS